MLTQEQADDLNLQLHKKEAAEVWINMINKEIESINNLVKEASKRYVTATPEWKERFKTIIPQVLERYNSLKLKKSTYEDSYRDAAGKVDEYEKMQAQPTPTVTRRRIVDGNDTDNLDNKTPTVEDFERRWKWREEQKANNVALFEERWKQRNDNWNDGNPEPIIEPVVEPTVEPIVEPVITKPKPFENFTNNVNNFINAYAKYNQSRKITIPTANMKTSLDDYRTNTYIPSSYRPQVSKYRYTNPTLQ